MVRVFDEELERSNVNLPVEAKEVVKENRDMSLSEACRRIGVFPAAYGEEVVEATAKREAATEQWEQTEAGIGSVLAYLEAIAGDSRSVSIEVVREEIEAFCDERGETIAEQYEESVSDAVDEYEKKQAAKAESQMEAVEEHLQAEGNVFPELGLIERLALLRDETPEETIDFLREQYPDVPDGQFPEESETQEGAYGR